jgi:hypothetical protein
VRKFYAGEGSRATTKAPAARRVGHEVELHSGNALAFTNALREAELIPEPHPHRGTGSLLHPASCRCAASDYYPIHAQYDSSSRGGEYVLGGTCGVLYGSNAYYQAINLICDRAKAAGMGVAYEVGSHVHTSNEGVDRLSHNRLFANYLTIEDDLLRLAVGEMDRFRANGHVAGRLRLDVRNPLAATHRVQPYGSTIIVGRGGKSTYEFRIWNASLEPQTLATNAGVCVAMVEAAIAGVVAEPGDGLVSVLSPWLTDEVIADAERRIAEDKPIPPSSAQIEAERAASVEARRRRQQAAYEAERRRQAERRRLANLADEGVLVWGRHETPVETYRWTPSYADSDRF